MLHKTSGLSRPLVKWVSQVTASVGATLVATMIYSALPKPVFSAAPPELTSGGKFAARAVVPADPDGLDVMPLPHVAPLPVVAAPTVADAPVAAAPPLHRAVWDGAAQLVLAPERPVRAARPARAAARTEPRHAVAAAEPSPPAALPVRAEPGSDAVAEDGSLRRMVPELAPRIVPAILSTAREAWSLTAAAGSTLVARVVPQIP